MMSLVGNYSDSDEDSVSIDHPCDTTSKASPLRLRTGGVSDDHHYKTAHAGKVTTVSDRTREERPDQIYEIEENSGNLIDDDDEYYEKQNQSASERLNPAIPGSYESDDTDSDSDDREVLLKPKNESKTNEIPLQNPFRSFGTPIAEVSKSDSVFQIQFLEDEQQKSESLQRHVKMTSAPGGNAKINGKKVCWNFRKGKCRFGHNCQYGHDSDLLVTKKASGSGPEALNRSLFTIQREPVKSDPQSIDSIEFDPTAVITSVKKKEKTAKSTDEEDGGVDDHKSDNLKGKKKRKRPGLTQNLTPGKKVMNAYYKNKDQ